MERCVGGGESGGRGNIPLCSEGELVLTNHEMKEIQKQPNVQENIKKKEGEGGDRGKGPRNENRGEAATIRYQPP